jgi:signal recognition particle GTPase
MFDVITTIVFVKSTVRTVAVRQPAVVEQLQQHVEDVTVSFFDLVQQQNGVRPAAHRLRQLATLFVTDIPRRRPDQSRDGMLLHEFAHVDPNHRPFIIEQKLGQRLAQFRLTDTGRAQENERTDRSVRILQPRP